VFKIPFSAFHALPVPELRFSHIVGMADGHPDGFVSFLEEAISGLEAGRKFM
jgi:hypothetical protein